MSNGTPLWGVMAEFASPEALVEAARGARAAGYTRVEAYAPFAVEGLAEAVGFTRTRVPLWTFVGGLLGGIGAYALQWYSAVVNYPIDVGGRPPHSWPACSSRLPCPREWSRCARTVGAACDWE